VLKYGAECSDTSLSTPGGSCGLAGLGSIPGLGRTEAPCEPLTAGHRFPAHHISQLITAAGVLRLIASTDISLDDPANDRLRTITLADPGVTIGELLTHTGGVDTLSSSGPYDPVLRERVPPLADLCGPVLACTGPRGSVTGHCAAPAMRRPARAPRQGTPRVLAR
jgi:CubicO group peptidase (beta-lactamase class C family)